MKDLAKQWYYYDSIIEIKIICDSSNIHELDDIWGRCRWSTLLDEPIIFVKYAFYLLNIIDTEKRALLLKDSFQIEEGEEYPVIGIYQSKQYLLDF